MAAATSRSRSRPPSRSSAQPERPRRRTTLDDDALDPLFEAAAEATEQAIVNALFAAETVKGYAGHQRRSIVDAMPDWRTRIA